MTIKELLALAQKEGIDNAAILAAVDAGASRFDGVKKSTFKKLTIEKGMYQEAMARHISVTQLLEEQDPSGNYGKYNLDAFERQLAVRGLQVNGPMAVALEEFYNEDNRILFPEFINREIALGRLLGMHTLKSTDLVAVETVIDSGAYKSATMDETQSASMGLTPEGTPFPVITLTTSDKTINLAKHGLTLKGSYESRRRIKANKYAVVLRLIGMRMERDMTELAVYITVNGDGNSNSAFGYSATGLTYNNLVGFWAEFDPYDSKLIVAPKAGLVAFLKLNEFKDALIAAPWLTRGELITPLGNQLKRHDPPSTSSLLTNKILGVDTTVALEGVTEAGSGITETDKIIDGQWDVIAISIVRGYARMMANGAGLWDYS